MPDARALLEQQLNDFDAGIRAEALDGLMGLVR